MSFVRRTSLTFLFALVAVAAIASPAVLAAPFDAGLRFGAQANETDLGLPLFPGAQVQRDDKEDKAAVRMDLWGGAFGLRMAVGKFKVAAKPEELQAFYAKALAVHGAVLSCKGPAPKAEKRKDKGRDAPLSCDDTRAEGLVLKVGSERNQRHVAIQAKGDETHFQIVRIEMKGD
jgi:hypothetical protein